jgi:hypothetical protein
MNIGGWGPREGMAAWAFAAAGLGADLGIATAVVYGVMALVASLPGAAVLITDWLRRQFKRGKPSEAPLWRAPAVAGSQGVARG